MPPSFYFYWTLLALTCGYAFLRGHGDERVSAFTCVTASFASLALLRPANFSYSTVEIGMLAVDILTLAAFVYVALRSDRFWPLWISGLQLTTSVGHVLKAVDPDLLPTAYAAAARLWSYPILIILAVGAWRGHRRMLAEQRLGTPTSLPASIGP